MPHRAGATGRGRPDFLDMPTMTSTIDLDPAMLAAAVDSKAWPFEEAKKIILTQSRRHSNQPDLLPILFQTPLNLACHI